MKPALEKEGKVIDSFIFGLVADVQDAFLEKEPCSKSSLKVLMVSKAVLVRVQEVNHWCKAQTVLIMLTT